MARLGTATRIDAARLLFEFETDEANRSLTSQAPALSQPQPFPTYSRQDDSKGVDSEETLLEVREVRDQYFPAAYEAPMQFRLPLPKYWGEQNDLNKKQKLAWILALIVLTCLSIGAITASIRALQEIF